MMRRSVRLNREGVAAVVVTFQPEKELFLQQFDALHPQVGGLVVVDNGSCSEILCWLHELIRPYEQTVGILTLKENCGIAAAHNIGVDWAVEKGFNSVLLMDHDSVPMPGMVSELMAAAMELRKTQGNVAFVGPVLRDCRDGEITPFVRRSGWRLEKIYCSGVSPDKWVESEYLMASGCLLSVDAYKTIGSFEEGLFVDLVDTEWILRARSKGYRSYGVCSTVMLHRMGDERMKVWFGRWRSESFHGPVRSYFQFRNAFHLFRRRYIPIQWKVNHGLRLLLRGGICAIYNSSRVAHIGMMLLGVWHGLIDRYGPCRSTFIVSGRREAG